VEIEVPNEVKKSAPTWQTISNNFFAIA
jgi:hypothetical protein